MRHHLLAATALVVLCTGCYNTAVVSGASPSGAREERQWFLLNGAARLTDPAGRECGAEGLAWSESKQAFGDMLISLAIGAGTALAVGYNCTEPACYAAAGSTGSLASWLLSSRTVEYACRRPSYVPPVAHPAPRPPERRVETPPPRIEEPTPAPKPLVVQTIAPKPQPPAVPADPVIADQLDEACLQSDECSKFGRCKALGAACVAANDAGCKQSAGCKLQGKCKAKFGKCVEK